MPQQAPESMAVLFRHHRVCWQLSSAFKQGRRAPRTGAPAGQQAVLAVLSGLPLDPPGCHQGLAVLSCAVADSEHCAPQMGTMCSATCKGHHDSRQGCCLTWLTAVPERVWTCQPALPAVVLQPAAHHCL